MFLSLLLLVGCKPDDTEQPPSPPTEQTEPSETLPSTTEETGLTSSSTGATGDTALSTTAIPLDCSAALPFPLSATTTKWNPSHEDFTFSPEGEIVGVQGSVLVRTPWGGPFTIQQPVSGEIRGTRFLPDGTLLMADSQRAGVIHLLADGSYEVFGSNVMAPNGITISPLGVAYVTSGNGVWKLDPAAGTMDKIINTNKSLDGITLSHDNTKLYYDTEFLKVWVVDLDSNGDPVGTPIPGPPLGLNGFSILDGMAADACGNIYVLEMSGKVFRLTPDGQVDLAIDIPGTPPITTPALNFGTGTGGFERDHLYVQDFRGWLHDIPIGIPGRWEPHLPVENYAPYNYQ